MGHPLYILKKTLILIIVLRLFFEAVYKLHNIYFFRETLSGMRLTIVRISVAVKASQLEEMMDCTAVMGLRN